MEINRGVTARLRIMRLLTLICFFHFSGLNNGITCMVVSSGRIESAGFAPVLISRVAAVLNPCRWSSLASREEWMGLLSRSGRVIEISSQKAIRNMFLESTLFQVWMHNTVGPGEDSAASAELQAGVSRALLNWSPPASVAEQSSIRDGGRVLYLDTDYEESWLRMERGLLKEDALKPFSHNRLLSAHALDPGVPSAKRALRESREMRSGAGLPVRRIFHSAERGSDEPDASPRERGMRISRITPDASGVIFFFAGKGRTE